MQSKALFLMTLALSSPASADSFDHCSDSLQPFTARYDVYRDHVLAGEAITELKALQNGHYRYHVITRGTHGWASLLGVEIEERSEFIVRGHTLLPLHFSYRKHLGFRTKTRHADYDWDAGTAQGESSRGPWSLQLDQPYLDNALINLALMLDLCRGETDPHHTVIKRGRFSPWNYHRDGRYKVPTPLGDLIGIRVDRIHPNPKRQTITWHIPEFGYLPARLDHLDPEDPPVSMLLVQLQRGGKTLHPNPSRSTAAQP